MENFSRVLVALDHSPMDQFLIRQARRVADNFGVTNLYFVHIIPALALPKNAQAELRKRFGPEIPAEAQVRSDLEQQIREHWGAENSTAWSLEVIEGKPYSQLLQWLTEKNIGLLIVGQKQETRGSGITARKLADNARCHVLFVPGIALREGQRLLVPVDFSEGSAKALQLALEWKSRQEGTEVTVLHITDLLATGYYLNRQEFESFNRFLMDTAKDSYRLFLGEHQIQENSHEVVILRNDEGGISERIIAFAAERAFDWIIVGAQGHGAIERFFFGSVTEKLVSKPLPAPALVVR